MNDTKDIPEKHHRDFLKTVALSAAGLAAAALHPSPRVAHASAAKPFAGDVLRVWSCGGLAEGMMPANAAYESLQNISITYTGAFAAALGKSLLSNGRTDVFAGRVLELAQKLRSAGRMVSFKPFCFTRYVIVTPSGNPGKIGALEDLAKPGVRVAMAPNASPPGGAAVTGILKLSGLTEAIMKNVMDQEATCVQTTLQDVVKRHADAMIVELRLTRMDRFRSQLDVIPIPEEFFPPGPLTFTIGLMEEAKNVALAKNYIDWMTSADGGQKFMEEAGFIPAESDEGRRLIEKLGVRDE